MRSAGVSQVITSKLVQPLPHARVVAEELTHLVQRALPEHAQPQISCPRPGVAHRPRRQLRPLATMLSV